MIETSRKKNSIRNMGVGIVSQFIILAISFVHRTFFIRYLGADYLGVNGLLSNILTVLSLAELGLGNVMIYSLYSPLAKQNWDVVSGLLRYFRKIYYKIAFSILILGLCLIPFLSTFINSELNRNSIIVYYLLFLINSVSSYLIVYKTTLINADQKIYKLKIVNAVVIVGRDLLQIFVIVYYNSYFLFLVVMIFFTILNNIINNFITNKLYPNITNNSHEVDIRDLNILEKIKSMFLYKIGVVVMNNTDNILISSIVGTIYVGYYSNYGLIVMAITTFINVIIQGLFSSIGNLNAENNNEKSYEFFRILVVFFQWISAFCSVSFFLLFDDFISLWIGSEYILEYSVLVAIVFNFYIQNIINPVWIYRETMGLFNEIKFTMLVAAFINIVLSIVLGMLYGMAGILFSTMISRALTTIWYEPRILFKSKFNKSVWNYWKLQIKYVFITLISALTSILIVGFYVSVTSIGGIIMKGIVIFITVTTVFILLSFRSKEFRDIKKYLIRIL
ncbi:lipopolysaccharide biosynthesis protein [Inediibacterium massiliense]|uniref:lipopolysaccharide biosynthesis protein n=1 Tax=Inediibacterium massiliense TaxID=1658111 RepID=UPI0006B41134|nr:hypothetical protein [Inediibacterium massiliense]